MRADGLQPVSVAWSTPPASRNVRQEQIVASPDQNATADDDATRAAPKVNAVRLIVDRVGVEDEGAFTCDASNAFGSASLSFTLKPFGELNTASITVHELYNSSTNDTM